MKNIRLFILVAVAAAFASCAKENIIPAESQKGDITLKTFTAEAASEVRTVLNPDKTVVWTEGDLIKVFDAAGTSATHTVAASDISENGAKVTFSVALGDGPYYACTADASATIASGIMTVTPKTSGLWSAADILVSSSADGHFAFHHAFGFVKFTITKTVTKVHFDTRNIVSGPATVYFASVGSVPAVQYIPGTTLCDYAYEAADTHEFYMPVIPGNCGKFLIALNCSDGNYGIDGPNDLNVAAGEIKNLGDITSKLEKYALYESFDNCNKSANGNNGLFVNTTVAASVTASDCDNSGWTLTSAYQEMGCIRFGSSSATGGVTTPALGVPGGASATIKFKIAPFDNKTDITKSSKLSVVGNGTLSQTSIALNDGGTISAGNVHWMYAEITVTGADADTKIKIEGQEAAKSRYFIDEFRVIAGESVPYLELDDDAVSVASTTTSVQIGVSSNLAWTASCSPEPVSITEGGEGSGTITLGIDANTGTSPVVYTVTVKSTDGQFTKTCTVTQATPAAVLWKPCTTASGLKEGECIIAFHVKDGDIYVLPLTANALHANKDKVNPNPSIPKLSETYILDSDGNITDAKPANVWDAAKVAESDYWTFSHTTKSGNTVYVIGLNAAQGVLINSTETAESSTKDWTNLWLPYDDESYGFHFKPKDIDGRWLTVNVEYTRWNMAGNSAGSIVVYQPEDPEE
ncbi:MAG: BACON domain-containing protein [Bacteroidales bacterium]|nr:BACON domain-containing protein [Bacteroidales bacterium]